MKDFDELYKSCDNISYLIEHMTSALEVLVDTIGKREEEERIRKWVEDDS